MQAFDNRLEWPPQLLPISNLHVKPFVLYCRAETATHVARYRNQDRVTQNGDWQTLYYDAVVELDPLALLKKIEAAQKAIGNRMEDDFLGRLPIDAAERQAIEDARHNLYFLKKHPATRLQTTNHVAQGRRSASATSGG
jgi:hypothetical protein